MTATVSSGSAATRSSSPEVVAILSGLDCSDLEKVQQAIRDARRRRAEVIPALIDALRQIAEQARAGHVEHRPLLPVGLCLLTEFQAVEALPVVIEILTLPGKLPEELLEDVLTETMPRTLATLAGNQLELLDGIIRDPAVNEYSRWAALRVRSFLVRDGRLSSTEAVCALQRHLRQAIDSMDRAIGAALVIELTALCGREAYGTIVEAFQAGIVDTCMIDLAEAEEEFAESGYKDRSLNHLPPTGIDDTIVEIEDWNWEEGDLELLAADVPTIVESTHFLNRPEQLIVGDLFPEIAVPHGGHVGRNEACPCGSGKKFKKCCGKPGA